MSNSEILDKVQEALEVLRDFIDVYADAENADSRESIQALTVIESALAVNLPKVEDGHIEIVTNEHGPEYIDARCYDVTVLDLTKDEAERIRKALTIQSENCNDSSNLREANLDKLTGDV